jgi:hypothetical protein
MSNNWASIILCLASWKMKGLWDQIHAYWNRQPRFYAQMLPTALEVCAKISVNGSSTIVDFASWIIQGLWNGINSQSTYPHSMLATVLLSTERPPSRIEYWQGVNTFCWGSVCYTEIHCIALFLNYVLLGQSVQYIVVYNITNVHAMSERSVCFCL